MKTLKQISFFSLLLLLSTSIAQAQNKKSVKKEGEMRVVIMSDENGEVTKTEKVFSLDDEEEVKKLLKEKGVEMNIGENSFHFETDGDQDGEVHKKIIVKTVEGDGENKWVDEDVQIYKFKSKSGEKMELKDLDMDINVEEIDTEDGKAKKIVIRSSNGDITEEVIVGEGVDVKKRYSMIFVRKTSDSASSDSDLPTSISESFDDKSNISELKLFPNPTNGNFNMSFVAKEAKDYTLTITDAKGSTVFEKSLPSFQGNFNEDYDLSGKEEGVYFFNLISDGENISKSIIVQ